MFIFHFFLWSRGRTEIYRCYRDGAKKKRTTNNTNNTFAAILSFKNEVIKESYRSILYTMAKRKIALLLPAAIVWIMHTELKKNNKIRMRICVWCLCFICIVSSPFICYVCLAISLLYSLPSLSLPIALLPPQPLTVLAMDPIWQKTWCVMNVIACCCCIALLESRTELWATI